MAVLPCCAIALQSHVGPADSPRHPLAQASKSALSEPTKLASQLAASLGSAQALAASLGQGRQQVLQLQSSSTEESRR